MDKKGRLTMRDLWDVRDRLEEMQRVTDAELGQIRPVLPSWHLEQMQRLALNDRLRLEDRMVRWYEMGGV